MNKIIISFALAFILMMNIGFAETIILPTHDEIIDNLDWWSKIKYNFKPTTFSALTEPDKWTCAETPTKIGYFNVPYGMEYTVSCGGDSIINLYKEYSDEVYYKFIRDDMSPWTYVFGSSVIGDKYIFECYSCTPYVSLDPCQDINCPKTECDGTTLKDNGYCFDGICKFGDSTLNSEICGYITPDPCAGINCLDNCETTTLNTAGYCANGICHYQEEKDSTFCGYLPPDPCKDVICVDECIGTTLNYDGTCNNGICEFSNILQSEECGFIPEDECKGVTCIETCDGETLNYNGVCNNGVCEYDQEFQSEICMEEDGVDYKLWGFAIFALLFILGLFIAILVIYKKR